MLTLVKYQSRIPLLGLIVELRTFHASFKNFSRDIGKRLYENSVFCKLFEFSYYYVLYHVFTTYLTGVLLLLTNLVSFICIYYQFFVFCKKIHYSPLESLFKTQFCLFLLFSFFALVFSCVWIIF